MTDVSLSFEAAKSRAAAFIGLSRTKTTGRVRERLRRDDVPSEVIDDVIAYFEDIDYLNDERAARALIRPWRRRRAVSRAMARHRLIERGVAMDAAMRVTATLDDDVLAVELLQAWFPEGGETSAMVRRLVGRGFTTQQATALATSWTGGADAVRSSH